MIVSHFSDEPLTALHNSDPRLPGKGAYKPAGLWVSDEKADQSWSKWCGDERWGLGAFRNDLELDLNDRVLHMKTATDLEHFTRIYGRSDMSFARDRMPIDWELVGSRYKGVIITPYIWDTRLDLGWYYGWDCASGVFWDTSCLKIVGCTQVERAIAEAAQ